MTRISPFKTVILASGFAMVATGAAAQTDELALKSLVAGYKAAFTCSAHFNAGRDVDEIAGDELHRIYRGYRETMAGLPDAIVDEDKKRVSVSFSDAYPPRVAQWRPHLGCVQAPFNMSEDDIEDLPTVAIKQNRKLPAPIPENLSSDENLLTIVENGFDRSTYGEGTETTAVIVVKDGAIIAEQYREGFDAQTPQRTWSVAKSIAATIIGAAVEDGHIDVDDRAKLDVWSSDGDPRQAVTIESLLHMSSGLTSRYAGNRTDDVYFGSGRVVDHAITNRLVAEPGTRWRYANNDTMIMMRALRERIDDDKDYLKYPFEALLHPLGMNRTFLETDWNGDFILSSQVWTTARDLTRMGLLYLNDGVWEGERILPEDWAAYVAAPSPDQPRPRADGAPRPGYGAHFWLYDENWGLPDGAYAARGNRGQFLVIVPARNVLVVRRGFDDGGGFDVERFTSDILGALREK